MIKPLVEDKELFSTGMRGEEARCRKALEFFIENMNADIATDRNGYFIHEVANVTDKVISLLGNKLSEK